MHRKRNKFNEHGGQARVLAVTMLMAYRWVVFIAMAFGSIIMFPVAEIAYAQTHGAVVLNTGYSPASMNQSNLPQSTVIQYDKKFVKNLKANTAAVRCTNRIVMEENAGNQHRRYMYQPLGANTSQQSEGTVGSGITISVASTTSTIGNYADYVNLSHFARITAIDPTLENIQREMAYRLGRTLSQLVINTADGGAAVDSSVDDLSLAANIAFTRSVITSATQSLAGRDVMPFHNGRFCGLIHPFIVGSALNDTTNNSLVDILKRTAEGQEQLKELPAPDGDQVQVMEWGGVSFYQTTMVTQTANYLSSGNTAMRTYIFGEDAIASLSLGSTDQVGDGDYRNLKLWMFKQDVPTDSDPSRVIGGWTSYNTYFTTSFPPDTTMRFRYIDAVSAIT